MQRKSSRTLSALWQITFVLVLWGRVARAADPIVAWNALALDSIRFANTPPPSAARELAILHAAAFDAVNGLDKTYLEYRSHSNSPSGASAPAAIAGAANRVLRQDFPQFTPAFDAELQAQLLAIPEGPPKTAGLAWGRQVAQDILIERAFDGASVGIDYRTSPGPGHWEPTPVLFASALLPQWPGVAPFALLRPDQFRSPSPPSLGSTQWELDFNEVKALGARNSLVRTPEQTEIAWFWADGVGTESPPGHWNQIAQEYAEVQKFSLIESARLFALLNLALADAGIAAWDAKYTYDWWRPITAIRAGDVDGNPGTAADPTWTPLITTPPFPEHVSGHSTFSAAAATVLATVNGSDNFAFSIRSDGLFGAERSFRTFSEAADEAGMSRIYGGIHFQSANTEGQKLGERIGEHVVQNFLLPKNSARIRVAAVGDQLELRWPVGVRIESNFNLDGPEWLPVAGSGTATIPRTDRQRYFRMR